MSRQIFLNEKDDIDWLLSTHLKNKKLPFKPKSFVLYGNEDWPDKIELYKKKNPDVTDAPYRVFVN